MREIVATSPVSRLSHVLIHGRDAILGHLFGHPTCAADEGEATARPAALSPRSADDPAAELRRRMNRIKAMAISEDGRRVDYGAVRNSADYRHVHDCLLPQLHRFDPASLATRAEQLAFWINLYNALVIDAVITREVQSSVTEKPLGALTFFRRTGGSVGGCCLSCDDIEHGILRGNRGHPYIPGPHFAMDDPRRDWIISPPDPRIHFALNCASRSCPPIGIYDAAHLEAQLDLATRSFVDQTTQLDARGEAVWVSPLFRWYAADFGGSAGVRRFLTAHLPDDARRRWLAHKGAGAPLRYARYDWSLNR